MKTDRIIFFAIRAVAAIIIFAVYVLICEAANIDDNGIVSEMGLVCICVAAIVTPIFHFVSTKLLRIDFGGIFKHFMGQMCVFLFIDFLAVLFYHYSEKDDSFYNFFGPDPRCILYFIMYVIGVGVYAFGYYFVHSIKNKIYGDMLRKAAAAVIGFPLYLLVTYIPIPQIDKEIIPISISWVRDYVEIIPLYIFFGAITVAATVVFHFISEKLLKVFLKKKYDYFVLMSFFICVAAVLYFAFKFIFGVNFESGQMVLHSAGAILMYILGNVGLYGVTTERKVDKNREEKSRAVDGESTDDEDLTMGSSEIILIPGIDGDLKDEKSSNDG